MLTRIARICIDRRRVVLLAWAVVLVGGFTAGPALFSRLSTSVGAVDSSESIVAARQLDISTPTGPELYAVADGRTLEDPRLRRSVEQVTAQLRALPGVKDVNSPYDAQDPRLISKDGRAVVMTVGFAPTEQGWAALDPARSVLQRIDAPKVLVGGSSIQDDEMDAQAQHDLVQAESIAMPVVLVLLVVVFGGVVAAGLPVLVALVGVAATLLALLLVSSITSVSVYTVNIVTMLGLGLAVDYALLLVSRYREERALTPNPVDAIVRTMETAGRTVAFSGVTVAASLAGLLVFPDDFLRSMGFAGLSVVLLDMFAALTLLPALLAICGPRISAGRPRDPDRGAFTTVAGFVRRRAVLVTLSTVPLLVLAAAPFLGARYADPDARSLPSSSISRQLADIADTRFASTSGVDPVTVVVQRVLKPTERSAYIARLAELPGVRDVNQRDGFRRLTVLDVVPDGRSQGPVAMELVGEVRDLPAPAPVRVAGDAAELTDYKDMLGARLPWALGVVLLSTFVLLFLFTGSVVVPLKALATNTLSLGASFGALVWVFQEGHLGSLVGTEALGSLSIQTPVLVFAIAFGLSMDYEVFLLGRIAEVHRRTGDSDLAVSRGLQTTGGVITAAALLLAIVFAGFVAGGFSPVKQVGLGLVLAVAVDATVVRMLLVPAVMSLMGKANWWAPAPLRRLHGRLGLAEPTHPGDSPLVWSAPGRETGRSKVQPAETG